MLRLRSVKVLALHVFPVLLHCPNALVLCSSHNLDGSNVPHRPLPRYLVLLGTVDHNKPRYQLLSQSFLTIPCLEQLQFQRLQDLLLTEFRLQGARSQLAGSSDPEDDFEVIVDSPEEGRYTAIYGNEGKLRAVLGINRPRHVMQFKSLMEKKASWKEALDYAREIG